MNTQKNDSTGTADSNSNGSSDSPKVIIDPSVLAEAQGATPEAAADTADTAKVEKTEETPAQGAASNAAATTVVSGKGGDAKDDEEPELPVSDNKTLKYGLVAAAILGVIALFGLAFIVVRNSTATSPTVVVPSGPAPASAPAATLPEVRTPAPRLIDATGCRRGQYRVEGNQLVFTNCATLELSEPAR